MDIDYAEVCQNPKSKKEANVGQWNKSSLLSNGFYDLDFSPSISSTKSFYGSEWRNILLHLRQDSAHSLMNDKQHFDTFICLSLDIFWLMQIPLIVGLLKQNEFAGTPPVWHKPLITIKVVSLIKNNIDTCLLMITCMHKILQSRTSHILSFITYNYSGKLLTPISMHAKKLLHVLVKI